MLLLLPLVLAAVLPAPVESVVNAAYAAPPELAADVLIRIAENSVVADRAQRLDLLERAFTLAEGARYPLKVWPGGLQLGNSREAKMYDALDLGLSRLDLQCRAAKISLTLDRGRGVDLFERIPPPQPRPLSCTDALAYRVDRYYDLAAEVFDRGFTDKERKRGDQVAFAARLVASATTPAQIEPLARLLGRIRVTPGDYVLLVSSLGRAVAHIQVDPRSFGATLAAGMLSPYVELATRCPRYGCSPVPLLDGMRSYLVTHLSGPRCTDVKRDLVINTVAAFNSAVTTLTDATNPQPAPISDDEVVPSRTEQSARLEEFQDSELSAEVEALLRNEKQLSEDAQVRDFIAAFDRWKATRHPDPILTFHDEADLHVDGAADIAPGPLRDAVIARAVAFFRDSPMLTESPPEWYLHVRDLLRRGGPEVAEEMRRSGGPVMALYVDVERLLSGPPTRTSTRLQ